MADKRPICPKCVDYMTKFNIKKGEHTGHDTYKCCNTIYCKTCKKHISDSMQLTYEDPVSYMFLE